MTAIPQSFAAIRERLVAGRRCEAVAGSSKSALVGAHPEHEPVPLGAPHAAVDHQPGEFTVTAPATTPVAEVEGLLAAAGQYLPFEPLRAGAGATLGGCVACGVSGPGRLRYGGIRDFLIGLTLLDGTGTMVRGGGRVVKNAAGFDLPKLMVGSLGSLGVMVELCFKVFPAPEARRTLVFEHSDAAEAVATLLRLLRAPLELDAADIELPGRLRVRLAGRRAALGARLDRLVEVGEPASCRDDDGDSWWSSGRELDWASPGEHVVHVALTPRRIAPLLEALPEGTARRVSGGGQQAWLAWPAGRDLGELDALLAAHDLPGLRLLGGPGPRRLGRLPDAQFLRRVRAALDPGSLLRSPSEGSMQSRLDAQAWGHATEAMAEAIDRCVHCGFCLPACPTYRELGEEMDSPRGRILLMKSALEGDLDFEQSAPYIDRCLGCLACEPACPSGVPYHRLLHPFREIARSRGVGSGAARLRSALLHGVLSRPRRFRAALSLARIAGWAAPALPPSWRVLLELAPSPPPPLELPELVAADGARRARVGLLTGCVQSVLAPEIGAAAAHVLARNGVEVVVPRGQGCCGSLALHDGYGELARTLASDLVEALPGDVDAWITTTAGCGSGIAEYGDLFAPDAAQGEEARGFAASVRDVHVFLDDLGALEPPRRLARRVAYQDACHLAHARGIVEAPRRLLRSVPGLELLTPEDGGGCCGSAGTYNLEHPEIAAELGRAKAEAVVETGASEVVSGNVGCIVQMRRHLAEIGHGMPVRHTVELLAEAWGWSGPVRA